MLTRILNQLPPDHTILNEPADFILLGRQMEVSTRFYFHDDNLPGVTASQCPIGDWHSNIGDPTLADAICDWLLHNAYWIELRGDSMRTRLSSTSENERKEAVANDVKLS